MAKPFCRKCQCLWNTVNVCRPCCLSPALILAQCCLSQERHHFLGKQRCYSIFLVHRCSCAGWPCPANGGNFADANLSPPQTNALCNAVLFQQAAGCPIADSVPNWHATAVWKDSCTGHTKRPCLCVLGCFFPFIILMMTSFCHCSCGILEPTMPAKITGLMYFICQDDHQSSVPNHSI